MCTNNQTLEMMSMSGLCVRPLQRLYSGNIPHCVEQYCMVIIIVIVPFILNHSTQAML
jgi:hypothetical protein